MIQAIETTYKAYRFRSRLEARWAIFLDALDVKWEYEKEGYVLENGVWYLPDFWLPKLGVWLEIKPNLEERDTEAALKCNLLAKATRHPAILIEGNPGSSDGFFCDFSMTAYGGDMWDMFVEEGSYPNHDLFEHQWMGGADYFEDLRQFVLIKIREGEYLSTKDVESISIPLLDEVARRKTIIELDRLYYRRKYNREHPRHLRSTGVYFTAPTSKNFGSHLKTDVAPTYYSELEDGVRKALEKARSARFEHGE